jgi:membrane protein implicated in regulation of membrane protease activity
MFPIPDTMAAFYLTCFAVGFLFVLVSLFLGVTSDSFHLPGLPHGDSGGAHVGDLSGAGAGGDAGLVTDVPSGSGGDAGHGHHSHGVSPINLSTIMAFLTWFGGAGYILQVYAGFWGILGLATAAVAGIVGGAIVFYLLAKVIYPGQRFLNPADYKMEGTIARVTVPIIEGGVGEIVYTMGGSQRSDGARSADGSPIERGTEVVIVRFERGLAYVEPWDRYVKKG